MRKQLTFFAMLFKAHSWRNIHATRLPLSLFHPQQPDSAAAQQALGLAEGCLERVGYARLYGIWATGACVLER